MLRDQLIVTGFEQPGACDDSRCIRGQQIQNPGRFDGQLMRFPEMRGNYPHHASIVIENGRRLHRLKSLGLGDVQERLELRVGAHVKRRHPPAQPEGPAAYTGVIRANDAETGEETVRKAALDTDFQSTGVWVIELDISSDRVVLLDGGIQYSQKRFACLASQLQEQQARAKSDGVTMG